MLTRLSSSRGRYYTTAAWYAYAASQKRRFGVIITPAVRAERASDEQGKERVPKEAVSSTNIGGRKPRT